MKKTIVVLEIAEKKGGVSPKTGSAWYWLNLKGDDEQTYTMPSFLVKWQVIEGNSYEIEYSVEKWAKGTNNKVSAIKALSNVQKPVLAPIPANSEDFRDELRDRLSGIEALLKVVARYSNVPQEEIDNVSW